MEEKLDILNRVQKAEPSPFLYTRILQRIQTVKEAPASVTFKFAFTAIAAVILLLNVWVFIKNSRHTAAPGPGSNLSAPYSSTINNIYYE